MEILRKGTRYKSHVLIKKQDLSLEEAHEILLGNIVSGLILHTSKT